MKWIIGKAVKVIAVYIVRRRYLLLGGAEGNRYRMDTINSRNMISISVGVGQVPVR
jgi:hypothetical protein